jgi:tRNA (cytidine/uridine-2'-O-)-methyltransferase
MSHFHIALFEPEIPGNTGNIGRLSLGLDVTLHLIEPLGFDISERAVRRAGIDHWKQVDLQVHPDFKSFLEWAEGRRMHLFSKTGAKAYTQLKVEKDDVLLFGCETRGLPAEFLAERGGWRIPLPGPARSLNLSNAVAVVSYHALRCVAPTLFEE